MVSPSNSTSGPDRPRRLPPPTRRRNAAALEHCYARQAVAIDRPGAFRFLVKRAVRQLVLETAVGLSWSSAPISIWPPSYRSTGPAGLSGNAIALDPTQAKPSQAKHAAAQDNDCLLARCEWQRVVIA